VHRDVRCTELCYAGATSLHHHARIFWQIHAPAGAHLTQPSQGLVRTIGRWSLAALMVNTMIGGGIFGLPSVVAGYLGRYGPLAYLIAGAGIAIIAACLSEVASQFTEAGGPYLYARVALGPFWGAQVGWMTWLSRIAATSGTTNLFIAHLRQFIPRAGEPVYRALILTLLIGVVAVINYCGVRSGTGTSNFFTVTKVLWLTVFIVAGLGWLVFHPVVQEAPLPHPIQAGDWLEAVLVLVYMYSGFEAAFIAAGETRNPRRDAPAALLITIPSVIIICTLVQVVVTWTVSNPALTEKPLAESARQIFGSAGASIMSLGALVSIYGYLSANMLHTPRLTYALSEQGDFPSWFGATHPRFRTPSVSIVVYTILLLTFTLAGNFKWNITLSAVARLFTYGSIALALPVLRRRRPKADAFRLPAGMVFSGLAMAFCLVLLARTPLSNISVVLITVLLATVNWFFSRRRRV
jgi:basic amino acid/polyamine antiporter, APA family